MPSSRLRQIHRKSRNGCQDCKKRHIKCDEKRPACGPCLTTDRHCSFLHLHPVRPSPASASSVSVSGVARTAASVSQSSTPVSTAATLSPPAEDVAASSSSTGGSTPISTAAAAATSTSKDRASAESPARSGRMLNDDPTPCFDMRHLVLLHHLETQVMHSSSLSFMPITTNTTTNTKEEERKCFEAIFQSAVSAPYLMYQLLAFSALHLSTTIPTSSTDNIQKRRQYRLQATELQARALSIFNNSTNIPDAAVVKNVSSEDCMPLFIFSAILGMHTLHDNLASSSSPPLPEHEPGSDSPSSFLDRITHYLCLHRGVGAVISGQSWEVLRNQIEIRHIMDAIETGDKQATAAAAAAAAKTKYLHETAYERLISLANESIDHGVPDAVHHEQTSCQEAAHALLWVYRLRRTLPEPYPTHIILAWPVRISTVFVELLEQRRPVPLIILAHWAVLLHEDRDFWVFGSAGLNIIKSLLACLDSQWDEWLELPRSILNDP